MIEALHIERRSFLVALLFQSAEPVRIEPGREVRGSLRDRQQAEFALSGSAGQQLLAKLKSSPLNSVKLRIAGSDRRDLTLSSTGAGRWSVTLPEAGDFVIVVSRIAKAKGRSTFSLTLGRQ